MAAHEPGSAAAQEEQRLTVDASMHQAFEAAERGQRFNAKVAHAAGHDKTMSGARWLHDFCTVRLSLGRGAGHSPLIARRAEPGDVILVARPLLHRRMREAAPRLARGIGEFKDFALLALRIDLKGRRIWVDDPTLTLPTDLHRAQFYELAYAMRAPQVMMIGM